MLLHGMVTRSSAAIKHPPQTICIRLNQVNSVTSERSLHQSRRGNRTLAFGSIRPNQSRLLLSTSINDFDNTSGLPYLTQVASASDSGHIRLNQSGAPYGSRLTAQYVIHLNQWGLASGDRSIRLNQYDHPPQSKRIRLPPAHHRPGRFLWHRTIPWRLPTRCTSPLPNNRAAQASSGSPGHGG